MKSEKTNCHHLYFVGFFFDLAKLAILNNLTINYFSNFRCKIGYGFPALSKGERLVSLKLAFV
ncbi:hypothetical protein DET65_4416 [Sunxiuqinia elliptica]|uniref:Uncharacterized protein n=1 Tax=Sunxiuqinia elliptica TaxID=655355 RepID=A0A4V3BX83_9BACT|nr:hypothetical protein DET52_109201 [Sunxiuqinia elliptica]TDO55876.1 hypothetical protein DET65_4416 [Sunxiuqinia elliptica]